MLAVLAACPLVARGQATLFDPRFQDVRRASVAWDQRPGPTREVVDVVCLVPDLPTFLRAVATWDEGHAFPILIDDVSTTLRFLRAFRPARIVRFPDKAPPLAPAALWDEAVKAVGRAWTADDAKAPEGDAPPSSSKSTPPGAVVSHPDSTALAGAVALAAGRFQPLLRWETARKFAAAVPASEAADLALDLERTLGRALPRYANLGDDLDFVTLAGDYPYRYEDKGSRLAFDDLILREAGGGRRWGYAGRLMGSPAESAYRAMCALFLAPETALLYNTYKETERPWSDYGMAAAAPRLNAILPTKHRRGPEAGLAGWHQTFDPSNPFGLVLLNTHGGPTAFHLEGAPGQTADVPESGPTALLMIHSFSAESPDDADTLAGRWLSNGAFVYFGSLYEPFLQAFRSPGLVASFLAENLPVVTAVRRDVGEPYGQPWRLVFFGDPLYRVRPVGLAPERVAAWGPLATWPAYSEFRVPDAGAPEATRLNWALKTAIFRLRKAAAKGANEDLTKALLLLRRDRLDPALRPVLDDLSAAWLVPNGEGAKLLPRLAAIPASEITPTVRRHREALQTVALQKASQARDWRAALALWDDAIRSAGSRDFARMFTTRVAALADGPARRKEWKERLDDALRGRADAANLDLVRDERKRVAQ